MKPNINKEKQISIDRLYDIMDYDPDTGYVVSLVQRGPIRVGQRLGCLDTSSGYRYIMVDGVRVLEHRLIWFFCKFYWPTNIIDHIDGNRANNKLSNLRDVSYRDNSTNKINNKNIGCNITKTLSNKFMVTLLKNNQRKSYGTYSCIEQAIYIRDLVSNYLDTNMPIPSKKDLKELAYAYMCN